MKHLKFIDSLGCLICGGMATHHHLLRVRSSLIPVDNENFLIPKRFERGMGKRSDDRFCIPLCHYHHMSLHHNGNEIKYLSNFGFKDVDRLALFLWENTGDFEKCIKAVRNRKAGCIVGQSIS